MDQNFDLSKVGSDTRELLLVDKADTKADVMLAGHRARGAKSVFVRYLQSLRRQPSADGVSRPVRRRSLWAACAQTHSRLTAESLPWWMRLFGTMIGASVEASSTPPRASAILPLTFWVRALGANGLCRLDRAGAEARSFFAFQTLVGLLLTNGPGASPAKDERRDSAQYPESPDRVQLNKALVGFLTTPVMPTAATVMRA